jgi:steroid 5-alpha reductase family enzyme
MTLLQQLFNPTYLHSLLTVLWGIRIFVFLIWREYISWPALHQKVVEVQSRMDIPYVSKLLCWLVYSLFYVALVTPCWSRLEQNCRPSSSSSCWGLVGYTGLVCQVVGLVLETVADWQKSTFKQQQDRHAWCNVGVWKWSTHPNYLGEGLFWWGTYLAHGFGYRLWHTLLATVGVLFITFVLKGSTRSLSLKHIEKYGDQPEFCQFQKTHTIWGSKKNWNKQNSSSSSNTDDEEVPPPESGPASTLSGSSGDDGGTSYDGANHEKSDSWI